MKLSETLQACDEKISGKVEAMVMKTHMKLSVLIVDVRERTD